ncbi:MAG: hydantoinase B/oxoprolinase family protein, partial [Chloroflexota bacterium]|nr:hydantoinase B/oxoprolinase family protein [Chloroflexota bacterium]
MRDTIDPITSEVVYKTLRTIVEEMGVALIRSAYSTNIKERRDCSCGVFSRDGELIALAEHIPIHQSSMQGLVSKVALEMLEWDFREGDVVIANDPYRGGGSHLPDVTLLRPVFYRDELVAFVSNIAHWSDVGGREPGVGTAGDSTELLQEGLRIPPLKIVKCGELQRDLLEVIFLNMRNRSEREGDFRAQIASLKLGDRRLIELIDRYGFQTFEKCFEEYLDYSENWLRNALLEIPDGKFVFLDAMDDDGVHSDPLPICITVEVASIPKPHITFDFSGTSNQAAGGINMVWSALLATVFYSVKAIVAPDVPSNAGFQRPIQVRAPKGCLVNAIEPAAVGGRTDTCQRVVDVIMGALSQAIPERVIAASNGATTAIIFGGRRDLTGKDFVYVEALGGGMGARSAKDGMDGVQVHITNTSNLPIEAMEMEYPLRVLHYGLVTDSGGAGKFRGGLSIRKDIQALADLVFSAHADRHRLSPWGLFKGGPGGRGQFILNPETPSERQIPSKISGVILHQGDVLRAQTAGGGGVGDPLDRDPESVAI